MDTSKTCRTAGPEYQDWDPPALGDSGNFISHLSPSLKSLNCLASRQDSSGPTLPPGGAGSEMAPTQTSMFWGVPYRSRNLWARVGFPKMLARSDVVFGTNRPQ